jgi:hypothetical protein
MNNLKRGFVSYASSAKPIKKAKEDAKNKPKNSKFPNKLKSGSIIKYKIIALKNPKKSPIPPKEGFD